MKSINQIQVMRALKFDNNSHKNISIPLMNILKDDLWDYTVGSVIKLAKAFKQHNLIVNIQNIAILSYRYALNIKPKKNNKDYDYYYDVLTDTSWDDWYTQL